MSRTLLCLPENLWVKEHGDLDEILRCAKPYLIPVPWSPGEYFMKNYSLSFVIMLSIFALSFGCSALVD
ncbi:hypothetical protein KKF84_17545, partial [Myxococcota bacterium]|nr:hypothetical protein [Myxococcota bacterium]